jgi:hypothetical protein
MLLVGGEFQGGEMDLGGGDGQALQGTTCSWSQGTDRGGGC